MENSKIDLVWDSPLRKEWKLNFWPLSITLGKTLGTYRTIRLENSHPSPTKIIFYSFSSQACFSLLRYEPWKEFLTHRDCQRPKMDILGLFLGGSMTSSKMERPKMKHFNMIRCLGWLFTSVIIYFKEMKCAIVAPSWAY